MSETFDDAVWMTVSEAQDYLKLSKTTLYDCMKDGRLPFYYVKGTRQRRIRRDDLDKLMIAGDPSSVSPDEHE